MSAGDRIETPRCLRPVQYYAKPGQDAVFPVCWRPAGHPGDKHVSRAAYLKVLARHLEYRREARRAAALPAGA